MPHIIIFAYGNIMRGDDAAGVVLGEYLQKCYLDHPEVEVVVQRQLLPEHLPMMAQAEELLFLDATIDGEPGEIHHETVVPSKEPMSPMSHSLTPPQMLGMVKKIYGTPPHATLWTLTGWEFEHHEGMTEKMTREVEKWRIDVVDYIEEVLHATVRHV